MERFADELDLAQYQTDTMTALAIAAVRGRFDANTDADADADAGRRDCSDCGEAIPQARLQQVPGTHRCVLCQERHERRSNLH